MSRDTDTGDFTVLADVVTDRGVNLACAPASYDVYVPVAGPYGFQVVSYDPSSGEATVVQELDHEVYNLCVAPDGAHVIAWGYLPYYLEIFDRDRTTGILAPHGYLDFPIRLGDPKPAISPDGASFYLADFTGVSVYAFSREAPDSDGDGLVDALDGLRDVDGDGFINAEDTDSDDDGIGDGEEPTGDADGDGLPNHADWDSDNDGVADGLEVQLGMNPYDVGHPDSVPLRRGWIMVLIVVFGVGLLRYRQYGQT